MNRSSLAAIAVFLAAGAAAAPQASRDAVLVDPDHHHVVLENDRYRVYENIASLGARSPMHTHPPVVVVGVEKARLRMTAPDGKQSILDINPGQVLYLENAEHAWEVVAGQLHIVAVEAKPAR